MQTPQRKGMSDTELPVIALTTGDPAGIGPEIVASALAREALHAVCRPLVIGNMAVLEGASRAMGVANHWRRVGSVEEAQFEAGVPDVLDPGGADLSGLTIGVVQAEAGRASARYIETAIELAMAGRVAAVATAPINKLSLRAGGIPYLDHTAMFMKLTDSPHAMTMFVLDGLRIFFATRHLSLAGAIKQLSAGLICEALEHANEALQSYGIERPRIAVAALNPHAGEGGLFGAEEEREIGPGIAAALKQGIDAFGPMGADSVFHLVRSRGIADAVLSLYHDQGHIAAKSMDFERTVAVTTGLPFVRASVDHGTAFDIAGTGTASHVSMAECVRIAARYAMLLRAGRASSKGAS